MPLTREDRARGGRNSARVNLRGPKFKIPRGLDPLVEIMFKVAYTEEMTLDELARRTGLSCNSINKWLYGGQPRIGNLRACLDAVGLGVKVYRKDDIPKKE